MSNISGSLAPDFFRGMKKPSAENCSEKFVQRFLNNKETDVINKFSLSLFLDAEGRPDCNQNNFDMKMISHLKPKDQRDVFSIAHDIALRNNQAGKVNFCKGMIKKIEETYGIKSTGNPEFSVVPQRKSMFSTIAKVVMVAAVVAVSASILSSIVKPSIYSPHSSSNPRSFPDVASHQYDMSCLDLDQFGYLQNCMPSRFSFSNKGCEWRINQQPISPEVMKCMELEESQQGSYATMFEQQLLNNDFLKSLETAKNIKYSMRDSFLNQIINKSDDSQIEDKAINLMSYSAQDAALGIVVDRRLSKNDCEGALKSAKKLGYSNQDKYLQKIVTSCKDEAIQDKAINLIGYSSQDAALGTVIDQRLSQSNCEGALKSAKKLSYDRESLAVKKIYNECQGEGIRNDIVRYLNKRHRIKCLYDCHPEEIRSIATDYREEWERINDKPISEETKKCATQCASEKTSKILAAQ